MALWEVYALKYAERNTRTRQDSFILDPRHDLPHPMDYFIWVLKHGERTILVDTGYDDKEGRHRGRPVLRHPAETIKALGLSAEMITDIIITHLHYDHAGCLDAFPNAQFYLSPQEMAYATGPCMCEAHLKAPYTADHICDMVLALYSGRVTFTSPAQTIAEDIILYHIGGHSRGLQAVNVKTEAGWLCLASDAAHFYENFINRKPFPIVVDVEDMLAGFDMIQALASTPELVIPGHDPLVTQLYPEYGESGFVWRLDKGAQTTLPPFNMR